MKSFEILAPSSPSNVFQEPITDEKTLSMGFDFALTDQQVEEIGKLVAGHLGIDILEDQMIAHLPHVDLTHMQW